MCMFPKEKGEWVSDTAICIPRVGAWKLEVGFTLTLTPVWQPSTSEGRKEKHIQSWSSSFLLLSHAACGVHGLMAHPMPYVQKWKYSHNLHGRWANMKQTNMFPWASYQDALSPYVSYPHPTESSLNHHWIIREARKIDNFGKYSLPRLQWHARDMGKVSL